MLQALIIDPKDNVANLVGPGENGAAVACRIEGQADPVTVKLCGDIPSNHKFAFNDIKSDEPIVKYGLVIGKALVDIPRGAHVHVHNIESNRCRREGT